MWCWEVLFLVFNSDVLHGFIATDLGETESDEDLHITISGHQENGRPM